MQHKQEGLTSRMKNSRNANEPDFLEKRGVSKEIREKGPPGGKVLMPGGAGGRSKKFHKKYNFDNIRKKFDATGKLDLEDFNSADEIGMFLDWYNLSIKQRAEKEGERDITEISKFLARMIGRTTISMGRKSKK